MRRMKQVGLLILLLACFLLPATAFAADSTISVQLNGSDMQFTDATPVMEQNRVYVPFRAVFEAMDADVAFDQATNTITATKDDTTVEFVIGNADITVGDRTVTTDAASFVRDGRTYVPVRFAAQSLGATVGWDGDNQTVVMVDKAALKASLAGQYTLMDQYMVYSQEFAKDPLAVTGTFTFDMQVANGSGEDAAMIPITGTMALDGTSTEEVASMTMAAEMDLAQLQTALEAAGDLTAEDKTAMDQLKAFDMQIIVNMETGKIYMKSALFALADMNGDVWYSMDLNSLLEGTGMDLTTLTAATTGSYEDYMMTLIDTLPVNDSIASKTLLQTIVQYQDENFRKSGNNYVCTMREEMDGMSSTVDLTLKTDGSNVNGYAMSMDMYMGTAPLMTMSMDQTGNDVTMKMYMGMEGMMTFNLNGTMAYSATNDSPQTAPASGETVVDLMETLMAQTA